MTPALFLALASVAGAVTPYREAVTTARHSVINLEGTYGVSTLRSDTSDTTGTGAAVDEVNGEIRLATGTDGTGVAALETKVRGLYASGHQAEAGVGIRIPTAPTGSQVCRWGAFDAQNGFGFGQDATGRFVFSRRAATDTDVYQTAWSERVGGVDWAEGVITQITWSWYGYGSIEWAALLFRSQTLKEYSALHRITPSQQTSVIDPNLPIRVECRNGGTASNIYAYVGGRSFQILGDYVPTSRSFSEIRTGITAGASETFALAIRKASTFRSRPNSVQADMRSVSIVATGAAVIWRLYYGATVTGGTWAAPTGVGSTESAAEVNASATSISGGVRIGADIAVSGQGASSLSNSERVTYALGAGDTVVLTVQQLGGAATADVAVKWIEEW